MEMDYKERDENYFETNWLTPQLPSDEGHDEHFTQAESKMKEQEEVAAAFILHPGTFAGRVHSKIGARAISYVGHWTLDHCCMFDTLLYGLPVLRTKSFGT